MRPSTVRCAGGARIRVHVTHVTAPGPVVRMPGRGARATVGRMKRLMTVVILLAVLWLVVSVLGALIEGLLWLTALGLVALAATVAYGWWRARSGSRGSARV